MHENPANQTLYWSLSKPLKYMGLTLDEWAVVLTGVIPSIFFFNSGHGTIGISLLISGGVLCYLFKKFKKISEHFLLKSYLVAIGILPPPISYPALLNRRIGK